MILYKGAGPGTHWWKNDPRVVGGFLASPGIINVSSFIRHILRASHPSPCLSFSASFEVARSYGLLGPAGSASLSQPGYVYEIDTNVVPALAFRDPAQEILAANPAVASTNSLPTHHDGGPDLLLAIAAPARFKAVLLRPPLLAGGRTNAFPPKITNELSAVIFALRDAEVFATTQVPASCIVFRHDVH